MTDSPFSVSDFSEPPSGAGQPIEQNSGSGAVGLFAHQFSDIRRKQLDILNKLHSLGASRDFDIPQIVVVGSQSAGKSSLIESISGITLPRSSGTCTRCPTECRLIQTSGRWQCELSIRFLTDDSGIPLPLAKTIKFGPPIYNREEIEDRIRRAQRAALNPSSGMESPDYYLSSASAPARNMLDFTTNCVSLEIRGSELTDLSFCDLPGLIASVSDDGREEDIEKVRELVSSYISKQNCIILLTVACETDFETQGAYRLAKQHDPEGKRTIGVLTKPDRIPEGETDKWISLIRNERSALHHGWFCVKQPSSSELASNLTFLEARRLGEEFFRRRPWSDLETRYQRQLGTASLTQSLSEHLLELIAKRFPELMKELQGALAATRDEIARLPSPLSDDPVLELMHMIGEFCDELFMFAEGIIFDFSDSRMGPSSKHNDFEDIRKIHDEFLKSVQSTQPNFKPFTHPEEVNREEFTSSPQTPASEVSEEPISRTQTPGTVPPPSSLPLFLDDVVELVQKSRTRELPGNYPYRVIKELILNYTSKWNEPANFLVDAMYKLIVRKTAEVVDKHFGKHTAGGLRQSVTKIIHDFNQARREQATRRVEWVLELETDPFTLNHHYLDNYRHKYLNEFRKERKRCLGIDQEARQPWNPSQYALEIMATVRAYFQVAYKRVADNLPLAVDRELIRIKKRRVKDALTKGLRITGPDSKARCASLLAEPRQVRERRRELKERLERLELAQEELLSAGVGFGI